MNCVVCEVQFPPNKLMPICCREHQYCVKCTYTQTQENNNTTNQTCHCCYRYVSGRYNDCEAISDNEMISIDHISEFRHDKLTILAFPIEYVHEYLLDEDIMQGVDFQNTNGHTPLYQYVLNIKVSTKNNPQDIHIIKKVQRYIKHLVVRYLNNFAVEKKIDPEILIQLLELYKDDIQAKMNISKTGDIPDKPNQIIEMTRELDTFNIMIVLNIQ